MRRAFVVARPPGHHNSCCDLIEEQFDIDEGTLGNFVWGCLGFMHLVLVLAHHQSQSEQSYLVDWPFGGQVWFEACYFLHNFMHFAV